MDDDSRDITQFLHAWGSGDKEALNKLLPLVHDELHRIASRHMKNERKGHMLQTTALLNEAYEKFAERKDVRFKDRAHFYAVAAQIMRRILIDYARTSLSEKRGGRGFKVSLDEVALVSESRAEELISL